MIEERDRRTARFTRRVEDYVRFRPDYPVEVVEFLHERCGLRDGARIADVGSGTGIFTARLLAANHSYRVFAIEPNDTMREAAESRLGGVPGFVSVPGTAESTSLDDDAVDLVTAAQAFHWFDEPAARTEFARILVPDGFTALVWNERKVDATPFLQDYEALLHRHGTDYAKVQHKTGKAKRIGAFFAAGGCARATFPNHQDFDRDGLRGRLLSSSYVPAEGEPGCDAMLEALDRIFDAHARDGIVRFEYDTEVYAGRMAVTSEED